MRLVELYEQYRDRVEFMVVYVREAHPTDKWWLAESRTLQTFFGMSDTLARADVRETAAKPVPLHLRNAATELMRKVGYGEGYRYAHDDPDAKREMDCLPPGLVDRRYFAEGAGSGD